jgi:hypothetical protein
VAEEVPLHPSSALSYPLPPDGEKQWMLLAGKKKKNQKDGKVWVSMGKHMGKFKKGQVW